MTQGSGFRFALITPPKVVTGATFKHHRNPVIKSRRMILYCLAKVKVEVDPKVKVRSHSLRSRFDLGDQFAYQSIQELSGSTMVPLLTLYLNFIGSY